MFTTLSVKTLVIIFILTAIALFAIMAYTYIPHEKKIRKGIPGEPTDKDLYVTTGIMTLASSVVITLIISNLADVVQDYRQKSD